MAVHNYFLLALTVLLAAFLVVSAKRTPIKKIWLKRLVNIFSVAAIVIMVLTVVLFPNFSSVKTTGEYAYTSHRVEFDTNRVETFATDGSTRKLSVLVYYPNPGEAEAGKCPLVVFSHGGISFDTGNLSLYKELASHGYIVAGISHTYHAINTRIGGKSVFIDSNYMRRLSTENSHTDIQNSYALFQELMNIRTSDINDVIDLMIEKSAAETDLFYPLIDTENIGVAGHSLGGSAAIGAARQRDDIKAVIVLEAPYMLDIIGINGNEFVWNTEPYSCAIMNIYSDSGYPLVESDNKYTQNRNYLYNNERVEYYYIEGSNHYSLTDLVRTSPILCALLGGGYKNGYGTLAFINEKSAAFFDKHLGHSF